MQRQRPKPGKPCGAAKQIQRRSSAQTHGAALLRVAVRSGNLHVLAVISECSGLGPACCLQSCVPSWERLLMLT